MERLIDGYYTLSDDTLFTLLGMLNQQENIALEPSALAGMSGPWRWDKAYRSRFSEQAQRNATHLVWATGGGMVPAEEMAHYLARSR